MKMKLTVLGVRGGIPAPGRQFMRFGGNTSCISIEFGEERLCFDAGSGLSYLYGRSSDVKRLHILISHAHIDHIQGLYTLGASYAPEIHLYGGAGEGGSFRQWLETVMGRPYWPISLSERGQIFFHEIAEGDSFALAGDGAPGMRISTLRANHPGGCLLYRVDFGGVGVTYGLDCEMNEEMARQLEGFAKDSSLLIWDANFVQVDKRPGWGHSTWEEGLAVGRAAGAERILMTHYSRDYTDAFLEKQEQLAQKECGACIFAREGMVIEL